MEYVSRIINSKITVCELNKYFGTQEKKRQILKDIDFSVKEGEFICLLGPSGCGKSTILNLISGLDMDYSGKVFIDGQLVSNARTSVELTRRMTYLFQEPRLLPWLTVEKNLFFALKCAKVPKSDWKSAVTEMLHLVHLDGMEKHYIHELSGGMQHRVAIARAFIVNPDIILMDEPFSALDELTARSIRSTLLDIWRRDCKTILFVTHNAMEATYLSDRIFMFSANPGEIEEFYQNDLPRPRQYESDELFKTNQEVVTKFMSIIGRDKNENA
ncbi:MAG: ABC transporter ATP-binding protein [Lachnospiraceae bacterium]|nr:ABC transporter ATP-binding protein [Lachnospiraceae bacterium]